MAPPTTVWSTSKDLAEPTPKLVPRAAEAPHRRFGAGAWLVSPKASSTPPESRPSAKCTTNAENMLLRRMAGVAKQCAKQCPPDGSPPVGPWERSWVNTRNMLEKCSRGPSWSNCCAPAANFDRLGQTIDRCLFQIGPLLARIGQNWPEFDQNWSRSGPNRSSRSSGAQKLLQKCPRGHFLRVFSEELLQKFPREQFASV